MWISPQTEFDPDVLSSMVIGIASELMHHDSGEHWHKKGQLLFSHQGSMRIEHGKRLWLLPPMRLAWIPAGVMHRIYIRGVVDYRSIYFSPEYDLSLNEEIQILTMSALLKEVVERIAFSAWETRWNEGAAANILAVCKDELFLAKRESFSLTLPTDRRISHISKIDFPPLLHQLARYCGASEKTITRLFKKETGLSYQQWAQQWKLLKAIEKLSEGVSVMQTASALNFSSDSAFITFFRQKTGKTPRQYMLAR